MTIAVTRENKEDGTMFKGACSNYLASREPGIDTIRVSNQPSTFRLPQDATRPILMIGPGTGIAPMRALLQERAHQRKSKSMAVGNNILYFGKACTSEKSTQDYIYENELKAFQEDGVLYHLRVAFSREEENGKKV
jgi:sulfite reductase alpha subunit-like flavoprotein